jgi:putative FmdB family regulatory protein
MPLFPYVCEKCSYSTEVLEPYEHKTDIRCPNCNKKLKRYIGSGKGMLYRPDYDKIQDTMRVKTNYY